MNQLVPRKLEEQFECETVIRIRRIQQELMSIIPKLEAGSYFAKELLVSLEVGLLLCSLLVSVSLLEFFIRELLISISLSKTGNLRHRRKEMAMLEKKFEDSRNPQWNFYKMIDELQKKGLSSKKIPHKSKIFIQIYVFLFNMV